MIDIVREIRAEAPEMPSLVHANAGLPTHAALGPALIDAGANIIGGCCGTTPEHIKAIKQAVENL